MFDLTRFVLRLTPKKLLSRSLAPLVLTLAALTVSAANASTIEIQFTGLDLQYDGTSIYDAGTHNTVGAGDPAQADKLSSMSFYLDGSLVGSILTTDIFADLYIANVLNIPAGGGVVVSGGNGGTFGVDLLTKNQTPGWGLALDINTMQFFYTGSKIAISVSGLATNLAAQDLPFGLVFDPNQPITIVMSSALLTGVTTAGGFVTHFNAAGTGNVAGTGVPEPTTLSMMGVGLVAIGGYARRRLRRS